MTDRESTELFSPATREWFRGAFAAPTPAQDGAWRAIAGGEHSLVVAPTGSGKTLAAFLWSLDRLATETPPEEPRRRCRVLYVSPLKALAVDVERNLRSPLAGIRQAAQRLEAPVPDISVGMRTGDTPAETRRAFARNPPDVLVTTPESLFLLLTSSAGESLCGVETVIVDEVHAMAGGKRGAHLAVSLERLDASLVDSAGQQRPAQRIGLSATVRPVEEVSTFLAGGRPVREVRPEHPKTVGVRVEVPVADMSALGQEDSGAESGATSQTEGSAAGPVRRASIWPAVQQRVLELVRAYRSTIVFTNSRRLAERLTARLNELAAKEQEDAAGRDAAREDGAERDRAERDRATSSPTGTSPTGEADVRFPADAVGESGTTSGPPPLVARAHHGSMSKEQRSSVEEELKSGRLPCVVATSSLELGIDMGAVDLVVQVEAPPTVSSGLQRIGRGGHQVGATSFGVVFPKFRGDLVSCAVVAERMAAGLIEEIGFPRNPLDVLAQQVVAMVAMRSWTVSELARVVRRAAPFAGLPDSALHAVLDMLSGRYPSEEFGELRPRIVWDRVHDELRGRPGAQRLAVTSGGTIPDRGLFTVVTPRSEEGAGTGAGVKVGELDEEMVYESRVGDTFLLGTSSWKVSDITHDRVVVVPAPGQPARMPFWKGDAPGRPLELGRALGAFVREVSTADSEGADRRIGEAGLDTWARDNLLAYLADQRSATGHLPDDRTILVERFRDELGDWRMVVHSPFGARVNAPWALAIGARLRERREMDPQVASSDDGIVLRLADALDESGAPSLPRAEEVVLDPDEVEGLLTEEVGDSALFAARFRECAARSLLLPRRDPRRRSPLWQQRQRAAQLLAVASKYEQFPVVLEAMRECLRDVYDVPGLTELMSGIRDHRVRVIEVETATPSPFARSLLFGYVGMFLYAEDMPLAERRSAALSLDSTLLAELLGTEALRELLEPEVVTEVERRLQRLDPEQHARGVEDAADLLRFLGDLAPAGAAERGVREEWLEELHRQRRALSVRLAGERRWIAIEDAGKVRDGLGVALPVGVPEAFTAPIADPLGELLTRYARCHGPFPANQAAQHFGLATAVVTDVLERLTGTGQLVRGELRPVEAGGGAAVEYCDTEVLRRLRRASLARLRAEVEPVEPAALGRFLPAWHGVSPRSGSAPTVDDVLAVVEQLAGAPIPASALESLILPSRLPGYSPALLDELTSSGEVAWTGCGALAGGDGWVALAPADVADLLLPDAASGPEATPGPDDSSTASPLHRAVLSALEGGALFFRELADRAGATLVERGESAPEDSATIAALWDLVWAGLVTNDTLAPLRALVSGRGAAHKPRRQAPRGRYARLRTSRPPMPSRSGPPTAAGRWSLASERASDPTRRDHARAEALLERHGVLTRGALETERVTGGFAAVYRVLRAMEENGRCRRGYVVEGLGPAQFAVPGAIDRLRALSKPAGEGRTYGFVPEDDRPHPDGFRAAADSPAATEGTPGPSAIVLAAADPAQPYGAALPWPSVVGEGRHRPGRKAGSLVVLVDGFAVLYVERGGRSVLSFTEDERLLRSAAEGVAGAVRSGWLDQLVVRRADGEDALASRLAGILEEFGFRPTPKGLRLRS